MPKNATPTRKRWLLMLYNPPPTLHRDAKAAAALAGETLSDWMIRAMQETMERDGLLSARGATKKGATR